MGGNGLFAEEGELFEGKVVLEVLVMFDRSGGDFTLRIRVKE